MIISINGKPGAGKSTVGKIVAKKLGFNFYSSGAIFRQKALEKNLSIEKFNTWMENNKDTDLEVDNYIKKLGQTQDNFVIDSRMAWYFIPHSCKIFLKVDSKVAAKRIMDHLKTGQRKNETNHKNQEDTIKNSAQRYLSELKRYQNLYNTDPHKESNYDLVIDASKISAAKVVEKIINFSQKTQQQEN